MDATPKLNEALAKAQAKLTGAKKDSENPHFRSKYADLASVWEAWQKVGPEHGLSITQTVRLNEQGTVLLVTTLRHTSGECVGSEFPVLPTKADMQGYGSALTYARRYCLAAMVGVAPEDDDGEAAVGRTAGNYPSAEVQRGVRETQKAVNPPVPKPAAVPRAVPSAKPAPKQAFVNEAMRLAEPPGLMDVPAISDADIPF
jgi:hypothetical protein